MCPEVWGPVWKGWDTVWCYCSFSNQCVPYVPVYYAGAFHANLHRKSSFSRQLCGKLIFFLWLEVETVETVAFCAFFLDLSRKLASSGVQYDELDPVESNSEASAAFEAKYRRSSKRSVLICDDQLIRSWPQTALIGCLMPVQLRDK